MASDFKIEFTNYDEVKELLKGLPEKFQSKALLGMLKKSAKPMVDQLRGAAPVSPTDHKARGNKIPSGTLKRSIGIIDLKKAKTVMIAVGARVKGAYGGYKGGWYLPFVEKTRRIVTPHKKQFKGYRKGDQFVSGAWPSGSEAVKAKFESEAITIFNAWVNKMKAKGKL